MLIQYCLEMSLLPHQNSSLLAKKIIVRIFRFLFAVLVVCIPPTVIKRLPANRIRSDAYDIFFFVSHCPCQSDKYGGHFTKH